MGRPSYIHLTHQLNGIVSWSTGICYFSMLIIHNSLEEMQEVSWAKTQAGPGGFISTFLLKLGRVCIRS